MHKLFIDCHHAYLQSGCWLHVSMTSRQDGGGSSAAVHAG